MESGQLWNNEYEVIVVNWGKPRPVCLDFSLHPFVFRDMDAPFLQGPGGHLSYAGFMTCFKEEGSGAGKSDLPASVVCSNLFNLKHSVCQGTILGGNMS